MTDPTVFLPVDTNLDFPATESAILAFWKASGIFEKSLRAETRQTGESRGPFVFYEGPPTANGMPHNGHVLTRAVKDVFPRYKTMCGFDVPRKAGWDTHGLPVEVEVEKELRIHGKSEIEAYGVEPFTDRCIESVFRYTEAWERLTDKIGFWVDLKSAYVTYHQSYIESVWWALSTLFKKGLLYQGHKVVWWWAQGGTALSSAEVGLGYKTVDDPSVFLKFPLVEDPGVSLLVWTTTPWTLPSNMYAAVHPQFVYAEVTRSAEDPERWIVARDLVADLSARLKCELTIVREISGRDLVGKRYVPPFDIYRQEAEQHAVIHSVIAADFVMKDASGIVHIAPAFGEDDNAAHRKLDVNNALPLFCAVAPDGTFTDVLPRYQGKWVKDCDRELQEELKQRGLLVHAETYRHEYPFCWRSDRDPLIQYARPAWYIRTSSEIQQAIANNQEISWQPEHIKGGRFGDFLRNNVDWALSRERYWGTPLNLWINDVSGAIDAPASAAEILERNPQAFAAFEAARAKDPKLSPHLGVHKPWIDQVTWTLPGEPGVYRRVPDVIDCWFDSGCMPFAQWGYPQAEGSKAIFERAFPADFISEAIDQTRGWFYSLLMVSTLVFDKTPAPHPYRSCVVLGHVCDKEGKKESKSKGNYTPPEVILERVRMEFAAGAAWYERLSQPDPSALYIAREDYEGLDLTGEKATVSVYREGEAPRSVELRPGKGMPRRIVAMSPQMMQDLGVTPPASKEVMPVEVPRLPAANKVWIEDSNTPAPGADAFRWFFYASSPSWTNTRHSLTNVRLQQKEFLLKLRNVYSFFVIYASIDGFDPSKGQGDPLTSEGLVRASGGRPVSARSELDRWLLAELAQTVSSVTAGLDAYNLYDAAQSLVSFVESLSNWYVRRSRGRFWAKGHFSDGSAGPEKHDAYLTLYEALLTTARTIAPFVPFFAEEMWQNLTRPFGARVAESVHLSAWPQVSVDHLDAGLTRHMATVRELVSLGLQVRTQKQLRVRQPLSRADIVVSDPAMVDALVHHAPLIEEELNVHEVRILRPGEEAGFVSYTLKPNFKTLGPKVGKRVQACKAALATVDAGPFRALLLRDGFVDLPLADGEKLRLDPIDVEVSLDAAAGFAAAGNRVGVVVLHVELTDALKEEGLMREVITRIQQSRKDAGCEFSERISVQLAGSPGALRSAKQAGEKLASETLADSVVFVPEADASFKTFQFDGETLSVRILRS